MFSPSAYTYFDPKFMISYYIAVLISSHLSKHIILNKHTNAPMPCEKIYTYIMNDSRYCSTDLKCTTAQRPFPAAVD